ncbi:MAG TPA: hypothetical protein VGM84_19350 [Steroidobacteraceae bacterium]|jgi:hypothetical protein
MLTKPSAKPTEAWDQAGSRSETGKYVISLCSVPVPITVPQPRSPDLARYKFFLHTYWEEGSRRHRLYMGYFASRDDAARWLTTLRKVYPSAFVSETPESQSLSNSQIVSLLDPDLPSGASQRIPARVAAAAPSASAPAAPKVAPSRPQAETSATGRWRLPTMADAVADLKASAIDARLESSDQDMGNTTGVRHLKIEVVREVSRRRGEKVVKPRKR